MIFLDKAILYLTQNIEKPREVIEEELEFVIKQYILNYLVNEKKININELSDLNITLVIDFEDDDVNNKKKMVVEEYMFEVNHKNTPLVRTFRLGTDNEHYIRTDLKELENEIDMFENGIGISKKD
ncbi:hypothetical protein [Leptotrichia wadei]|mgnify:FL=1|jgi:hypothetical protein|uniref:Uncharacterized protein n=1 Tax=Leptotrichia wadei TaxID=157687 RepID=A0A510KKK9_9FUSO|nr:hypothetical protein [Leptotrichia wadei]BBM50473.1 hypothetical protein JMUB3934_1779 [Leptotrichia wadei]